MNIVTAAAARDVGMGARTANGGALSSTTNGSSNAMVAVPICYRLQQPLHLVHPWRATYYRSRGTLCVSFSTTKYKRMFNIRVRMLFQDVSLTFSKNKKRAPRLGTAWDLRKLATSSARADLGCQSWHLCVTIVPARSSNVYFHNTGRSPRPRLCVFYKQRHGFQCYTM